MDIINNGWGIDFSDARQELPAIEVQTNRALLFLKVIDNFMDIITEKDVTDEIKNHLRKLKRWSTLCRETLPKLPKKSACERITESASRKMHKLLGKKIKGPEVSVYDVCAAWIWLAWELLVQALATAKEYTKNSAWRYMDEALTVFANALHRLGKNGQDIGVAIFWESDTL